MKKSAVLLVLFLGACGRSSTDTDAALVDAALVDAALVDATLVDATLVDATLVDAMLVDAVQVPDAPVARALQSTSGGGTIQSSEYVGHVKIGAPQPMGSAASDEYRVRLGPISKP